MLIRQRRLHRTPTQRVIRREDDRGGIGEGEIRKSLAKQSEPNVDIRARCLTFTRQHHFKALDLLLQHSLQCRYGSSDYETIHFKTEIFIAKISCIMYDEISLQSKLRRRHS